MGLKCKEIAITSSLSLKISTQVDETRIEIFHVRVISKHTNIDTLFDSGSQANLISKYLVKKLNLETTPH